MADLPRIIRDPDILAGKPVIRGTRLSVGFVIGLMAEGWSEADIIKSYPGITRDDIVACLAYARDMLAEGRPGAVPSETERAELLGRLRAFRGRLPADFKFDRDEANAR